MVLPIDGVELLLMNIMGMLKNAVLLQVGKQKQQKQMEKASVKIMAAKFMIQ